MPYKFTQVSPGIFLFRFNDINTFQLIVSNVNLVKCLDPIIIPETSNDAGSSDSIALFNVCTIHNAKVSRKQSAYYGLANNITNIQKRMPAAARFYNSFMKVLNIYLGRWPTRSINELLSIPPQDKKMDNIISLLYAEPSSNK